VRVCICVCVFICMYMCVCVHLLDTTTSLPMSSTGWRRLIGSPKLQIISHKRATKYSSLLRRMTYKDKGSYESSPPCISHMYFKNVCERANACAVMAYVRVYVCMCMCVCVRVLALRVCMCVCVFVCMCVHMCEVLLLLFQ